MVEATAETIGDAIHLVHNAVKFSKRVKVDVRALDPLHLDVLSAWLVKLKQGGADLFMWSEDNFLAEVDVNLNSKATHQNQERGR